MKSVVFHGIRGGTGTTSTVAAIGDALHALNETVLMIDLASSSLLSLHFGGSPADSRGWARSILNGRRWDEAATEIKPGLHLLPFGLLTHVEHLETTHSPYHFWQAGPERLDPLSSQYSVILIDAPYGKPTTMSLASDCDLQIMTTEADPASCALLVKLPQDTERHYLITRYDPISRIQRDIRLLWQTRLGSSLLPQVMHRDASVVEALGYKLSVGSYRPNSLAAQDAMHIAAWCQEQLWARQ